MPMMKNMSEAQLFYLLEVQFCMQTIDIVMVMDIYHMIPFIRNDITFQYFTIFSHRIYQANLQNKKYLNTYI